MSTDFVAYKYKMSSMKGNREIYSDKLYKTSAVLENPPFSDLTRIDGCWFNKVRMQNNAVQFVNESFTPVC